MKQTALIPKVLVIAMLALMAGSTTARPFTAGAEASRQTTEKMGSRHAAPRDDDAAWGVIEQAGGDCPPEVQIFGTELIPMTDWHVHGGPASTSWCIYLKDDFNLAPTDMDGDGRRELFGNASPPGEPYRIHVYRVTNEQQLVLFSEISEDPSFYNLPDPPPGFPWTSVEIWVSAIVDMNEDGLPDAVAEVTYYDSSNNRIKMQCCLENTLPPPPEPIVGDVNGDGVVDVLDLLAVLAAWGP